MKPVCRPNRHAHGFQKLIRAALRVCRSTFASAIELQSLTPSEVTAEAVVLGRYPTSPRLVVADWLAQQRAAGFGGVHHGHHDLDQRGLPAVRSKQSEDFAAANLHAHTANA